MEKKENNEFGTGYFTSKIIMSAVMRAEFVTDWISSIVLRGHWCDITALNIHAPIVLVACGKL
jgi:hypothetical protein